MCGIIGYVGKENAFSLVVEGLKNLEYRGYDSYGVVYNDEDNLGFLKEVGKVSGLSNQRFVSNTAIGHTRWATHGSVTRENAHPHFDCNNKISVVHNGIIENYEELKKDLINKGHVFKSDTDSEVVPHLIEEELKKGIVFEEACKSVFLKLEGSFAILVLKKGEDKIYGVRKDSPLVLGISDNGFFAASDAPAFLKHTKKVIWLYNYDFFILSEGGWSILNLKENKVMNRVVDFIDWDVESVKKGEFKHFMLKEILEQVQVLKNISKRKDFEQSASLLKSADKVLLIGSGTSYHACLSAEYLLIGKGVDARAIQSSEFSNYVNLINENTLVVAVSQSGETADVLEAVKIAKNKKAKVLSLVNVKGSSLERVSDKVLLLNAGPEICVLSTKSYTSQVALLVLIFQLAFGGEDNLNLVWNELYNLTSKLERKRIEVIADKIKDAKVIVIIGRNEHYVTALEAGLKIREVSYIPVLSFAGGELKHGNIALIEKGTPCIVFGDDKQTLSNAVEMKSRGGWIIGVSEKNQEVFDDWIKVFNVGVFNPVMFIVPAQILAYYIAVLKGLDPDKPRNLAKSVTVK